MPGRVTLVEPIVVTMCTNLGLHLGHGVTVVGYLMQISHASCHEPDLSSTVWRGHGQYRPFSEPWT